MSNWKKLFVDPPTRYRGAPFWSWNDRLEVEELVRQVHDMKAHGMGGFFMHSREGLETEYMGEQWIRCIRETVDAAEDAGTYAWLYDEDRWPSGAAGGLVPARGGDAFRAKRLEMIGDDDYNPENHEGVLAVFRTRIEGGDLQAAERLPADEAATAEADETILVFRRAIAAPSEWFNDDAPPDNLNPDSVAAFLDITYEAYYEEVGEAFGDTVPGIFTDEPNVAGGGRGARLPWVPWTDGLDGHFRAHRGYDLLNVVPYLFLDGPKSHKTRHDFWWTISERYTEAFSKQVGEWCEQHGLAFTGHYLSENEMGSGIVRGGALMPHYQYQHVPGIDMLTVQTHENLTVKQCTSVAHQFGREFVLSETYGCSGWEMTFEDQKWVGDWQYVLGVSLRCQHLALYSLRGCRKRDYPPSFNYNTTWWKYNG
ncbi:MAG: glycosyl hydrolase, partial [Anaerolineae bacterium]